MTPTQKKSRILVFHIGHLGDSLMILPAMRVLRDFFKDAELTLFFDTFIGKKRVAAQQVFDNTDYFDRFLPFPKSKRFNKIFQALSLLLLIPRLRTHKFDALVYLVPSNRSLQQVERDRKIFKLAGIHHFIGMADFFKLKKNSAVHEADLLLTRLQTDGLDIPKAGTAAFDLKIQTDEKIKVDAWFAAQKYDDVNPLIAFAPGSKMQSKRWSLTKFAQVGKKLIAKYDVTPIVFGGPEDAELGETLITSWGRGYNAAGALNVRQAAEALRRCALYIGNDTGAMHLAASMGTPCAAIFSARDSDGKWHPYGHGHIVFREHIKCQGCMLEYCDHKSCLQRISPLTVFRGIEKNFADILKQSDYD